jgi:hypothetical protein
LACCLTLLPLFGAAAQIIPKTGPDIGTAEALPPGPTVTDWQPRGRAAIGTRIVVTGPSFRPADVVATIGANHFPLPVRLASSTTTRIELDVPATALGQIGKLAITHRGTRGTVIETIYRIDNLVPAYDGGPRTGELPFVLGPFMTFRVKEFPGVRLDSDRTTVGGTCAFRKNPNLVISTRNRNADMSVDALVSGWFERPGSCTLQLGLTPIAENGSPMSVVQISVPFTVPTPQRYAIESTGQLIASLQPALARAGLGSTCEGTAGGGATGVTTVGSDLQILIRGGALDVSCTFRTGAIDLAHGVRLTEIRWISNKIGNRCGNAGTVSSTLPSVSFSFTRGTVRVNPDANQAVRDFFVFGQSDLVNDGVTVSSTVATNPRTALLSMVVDLQCVSMATVLTTSAGTFGPTTSPQSYGVILDRIVFEGPPGLSTSSLFVRR